MPRSACRLERSSASTTTARSPLFIGHEFERKGLPIAMSALRAAPDVLLLVVGGSADMIRRAQAQARQRGRLRARALRGHPARSRSLPLGRRPARASQRLRGERARRARGARVRPAGGVDAGGLRSRHPRRRRERVHRRTRRHLGGHAPGRARVTAARRMARARPAHGRAVCLASGRSPVPRPRRIPGRRECARACRPATAAHPARDPIRRVLGRRAVRAAARARTGRRRPPRHRDRRRHRPDAAGPRRRRHRPRPRSTHDRSRCAPCGASAAGSTS